MSELKAIPTTYKGIEFRSRLEAKWAVFFDACDLDWEYEPEGFELSDGTWYLPDFLLHTKEMGDLWIEVKGNLTTKDLRKVDLFFKDSWISSSDENPLQNARSIIILGSIPKGKDLYDLWFNHFERNEGKDLFNFGRSPYLYPDTVLPGMKEDGSFDLFSCFARHYCSNLTYQAYQKALSAKFEHGQTPNSNSVDVRKYKEKLEELLEEIQEALDVL